MRVGQRIVVDIALIALPIVLFVISLVIGSYAIDIVSVCHIIAAGPGAGAVTGDAMATSLVWQVRMPRAVAALFVGAGLSVAGAVFQGLFKNPLASPYTLGVSNGAGFGAGLAIILLLGALGIQALSIACGLLAVGLRLIIGSRARRGYRYACALRHAGELAVCLARVAVKVLRRPNRETPPNHWIMGSLSGVSYECLFTVAPLYVVSMIVLFALRWRINVLSLGDQEARSIGVDVRRDRGIVIGAASVLTALEVSVSGIIGWVGIVVPHLARILVGPDYRRLLPASASLSACYLLVIDDVCRTLTASEIPTGVVTGIVGVPMFLCFIYRRRVAW